jgi:hypothetical protein
MTQYDDQQWLKHFQMTKDIVLQITLKLQPSMEKKNSKHKVGYSCWHSSYLLFFKLAHGADYFQCNKIFAIGKPFMNMVFMSLFLVSTLCSEAKLVGHVKIYNNGGLQ